mgnify:CR=1 FL=1
MRVRPATRPGCTREAMEDFTYRDLEVQARHHHSPVLQIRRNRPAALHTGLRHRGAAQAAFQVWRRRASLPRSFHCPQRHDRGAEGAGQAHQKSALRRRAGLAAGQREYRPRQAADRLRSGILNGNRPNFRLLRDTDRYSRQICWGCYNYVPPSYLGAGLPFVGPNRAGRMKDSGRSLIVAEEILKVEDRS